MEDTVYRHRLYEASASNYRIQYAVRSILRGRVADGGAFNLCFEMADEERIIRTILRRGLRSRTLRSALEGSHLIDLTHWLQRFPDLAEAYYAEDSSDATVHQSRVRRGRAST